MLLSRLGKHRIGLEVAIRADAGRVALGFLEAHSRSRVDTGDTVGKEEEQANPNPEEGVLREDDLSYRAMHRDLLRWAMAAGSESGDTIPNQKLALMP